MVERATIAAVEAEAVDEPGLEVADEELVGGGVVGDGAEAGTGVVLAVVLDVGEERDETRRSVDLPDRAGRAALVEVELAGHPAGTGLAFNQAIPLSADDLQPEQRCRRDVDIRRRVGRVAVERHAEHLTDLAGRRLKFHRSIGNLTGGPAAELRQVEHLKRRAVDIDESQIERMEVSRRLAHLPRAGECSDGRVATVDDSGLLGACRKRDGNERGNSEKGSVSHLVR